MWHWTNGQLTFNVSAQLIDLLFTLKVGSIEGRVGVHHIDDSQQSKNFTFKCHREGNDIFSVNSLNFHPVRFISLYSFINYMWGLWFYFYCLTFVVRSVQMQ